MAELVKEPESKLGEHARELEPRIHRIHDKCKELASGKHSQELLQIIKRPGWTTPAEAQLVRALLDSISYHLDGIERSHSELNRIADRIGQR